QISDPDAFYRRTYDIYSNLDSESFDVLELKDGRIFERYSRPQRINDRTVGRVWSFRDVTARRRAEAALQESEAKFRQIFDVSADAVAVSRVADGKVLEVNESYCRISGYSREEVVGKTAAELGVWVDLAARNAALERLRRDGAVHNLEAEYHCKNGSTLHGLVSACQARIAGEPCIVWFVRDIAETKRAQEAVRRSEEKYRTLFEESKDALFIATLDGELLDANPAAVELFGYDSREQFLRLRPEAFLIDAENRGVARRAVEKQGFLRDFEMRAKRSDGEVLTVLLTATPMWDERGELVGLRGIVRDVTTQRKLEAQLRQAQKLEALGRLASGVAHEVNNPLTWVLSHLEALRDDLPRLGPPGDDPSRVEPLLRRVGEAMEGTQRVARIIRDLQTFTRTEEKKRAAVDVNSILESALSVTADTIRRRARLVKDLGELPPLWGDSANLSQVFVHLLTNAAQAIGEGRADRNEIGVHTRREEGDVIVEISDTGGGIAPEHRDEIFDPYFTTRPIGEGLGLGLSISRNIVAAHGGRIEVESEPGAGSRFTIRLPADARKPARWPERRSSPEPKSRRARILVVDDEPLVRAAVASSLRIEYEVVEAASGRQALEILKENPEFEAILCDLMMAETSGMELHDILRGKTPELAKRIVFMTGGAFTRSAEGFLARVTNPCLEKPFTGPELLSVIRHVIAPEGGR
ncbi:MAG: PAS domain-containing hybrid sensor histidine kinase/response regulator, partial [Candidatus Binatia bacterium]